MRKVSFVAIFLLHLFCQYASSQTRRELQLVQIIFRHGERVPEYPYPTDPYNSETFWKEGWAQLTDRGKEQEYQLGVYLRQRYQGFISDDFVPKELYVLSSDTDRTIMSAQLALAGMFPTVNGTPWNPQLHWQPIPIHTLATKDDNLLRYKIKCPKFNLLLNDALYNSPEAKQINKDNKELFENLSIHSGVNISNINDIDAFYATMMVEEMLGLEIPEWGSVTHSENFQYLYNLSFAIKTSTQELKRLRIGPLLQELNGHFHEKITNSSMKTKLYAYSAHDTTLVDVLNGLGILDLHRPQYGSIFFMEMYKDLDTKKYYVNLLLRNETSEPYKLRLPTHEFDCLYEDYLSFTNPLIPENWSTECLQEPGPSSSSTFNTVAKYILTAAVALFLLVFAYFLLSKTVCRQRGRAQHATEYERF